MRDDVGELPGVVPTPVPVSVPSSLVGWRLRQRGGLISGLAIEGEDIRRLSEVVTHQQVVAVISKLEDSHLVSDVGDVAQGVPEEEVGGSLLEYGGPTILVWRLLPPGSPGSSELVVPDNIVELE